MVSKPSWSDVSNWINTGWTIGKDNAVKAGKTATKTNRRTFLTATGAVLAGDQLLNDGDLRQAGVAGTGNLVEEALQGPMGLETEDLMDYNEKANAVLDETGEVTLDSGTTVTSLEQHRDNMDEGRETSEGEVPELLEAGDTFVDEKYLAMESDSEQITGTDSGEEAATASFSGEGNEWFALTETAAEAPGFDDFGFLAINSDNNVLDYGELGDLASGYDAAVTEVETALAVVDSLIRNGRSYKRNAREFEDEDELADYNELEENVEELQEVRSELRETRDQFQLQEDLFRHTVENTHYNDGAEVGSGFGETPGSEPEPSDPEDYGAEDYESVVPEDCELGDRVEDELADSGYAPSELDATVEADGELFVESDNGEFAKTYAANCS